MATLYLVHLQPRRNHERFHAIANFLHVIGYDTISLNKLFWGSITVRMQHFWRFRSWCLQCRLELDTSFQQILMQNLSPFMSNGNFLVTNERKISTFILSISNTGARSLYLFHVLTIALMNFQQANCLSDRHFDRKMIFWFWSRKKKDNCKTAKHSKVNFSEGLLGSSYTYLAVLMKH